MTDPLRTLVAGLLAPTLTLMLPIATARAQPPAPDETAATSAAPADDAPTRDAVEAALADGDLGTARDRVVALTDSEPSTENLELEASVWLALGDYANAKRALREAIDGLPEDAHESLRADLEAEHDRIEEASRGTVADEPASTHRERLDEQRALANAVPEPPPAPTPVDEPKPEPIVKKWYFWVTLGAIVASAGAIAGVAIQSRVDENNGDAASRTPAPAGGLVFRF